MRKYSTQCSAIQTDTDSTPVMDTKAKDSLNAERAVDIPY